MIQGDATTKLRELFVVGADEIDKNPDKSVETKCHCFE